MKRGSAIISLALAAAVGAVSVACGGANATGAAAPNASIRMPLEVYDYTLPNGMRVILDDDRSAPTVAVNVWYKVGSKDDPPNRAGFAHLFEHLMFVGTHSIEGDVFPMLLGTGATSINASTSRDRTEYHETVRTGTLEWTLWFEAERLATMGERLDQATFDRERAVVKNELRQRYENVEGGLVSAIITEALFGKSHPYGHRTIGTLQDLDAATLDQVRAFHRRAYRPANAVLAVVGDFDRKQALSWVQKYFGAIPTGEGAPPVRQAPLTPLGGERRLLIEANVPYPVLHVTYRAPAASNDLYALGVVSGMLESQAESFLIGERKLVRSVSHGIEWGMLGSQVDFALKLERNADPNEVLRVLDEYVFASSDKRFGSINFSLNRVKTQQVLGFEDFESRARRYAYDDDQTGNPLFIARTLEAVHNTSRADALAMRNKVLRTRDRVVSLVRPTPSAPLGGRLASNGGW